LDFGSGDLVQKNSTMPESISVESGRGELPHLSPPPFQHVGYPIA